MPKPALIRILPVIGFFTLLISPIKAQKDFPDAPAKEFVNKICLQCHEPSQLLTQKRTESDWKKTIARMSQKGIPGTIADVSAYGAVNSLDEQDFVVDAD